jgi:hypothetical protein
VCRRPTPYITQGSRAWSCEPTAAIVVRIQRRWYRRGMNKQLTTLGWREWVQLPGLGVGWVKAKVDTGARSSSLHAFALADFSRDGADWVRFSVHPWQDSSLDAVEVEAPVVDRRVVRSSSGRGEERPVITTTVQLASSLHEIELTLTSRDAMGFRMLLGRQALRWGAVVSPSRSYVLGKPGKKVRDRNRQKAT